MGRRRWEALAWLVSACAYADVFTIEVEVDAVPRWLSAHSGEDPLVVAQRFCESFRATENVEGLECASTLAEELIFVGARHPHLPYEPALRLSARGGGAGTYEAVAVFCEAHALPADACNRLSEDVAAVVPHSALGLGELQIPVAVRRNGATVVRPTAVLRVDVEPAATLLAFEPSVAARVVVEPEAPDCARVRACRKEDCRLVFRSPAPLSLPTL